MAKSNSAMTRELQMEVIQEVKRVNKRLLEIVADPREPDFAEVEVLAAKTGFKYNDYGQVVGG